MGGQALVPSLVIPVLLISFPDKKNSEDPKKSLSPFV